MCHVYFLLFWTFDQLNFCTSLYSFELIIKWQFILSTSAIMLCIGFYPVFILVLGK
uniref:Uncharacterized protein n=1 Tax=Anguilla anguilla TaxID=7936 RepID=A0A0E9S765_ANGAN